MTDKQDPIAHAARLLRETAEELRQTHAYNNSEGWENETDAKTAYDEHMAAAQALEDWEAAVGAGGVQALSAAPEAFLSRVIALCTNRGSSPENIEAWDKYDKWIADLWRQAEAMLAASPTPPAEQQAAPKAAPGAPAAIKMVGYGGCTGINDYLMSDGTIKTMRQHEVVWRETPLQAVAGEPVANDIHGALTAAAIYLTNAQRQYGKEMHRQAIASLEKAKRAVAQAADFAKAAPQQEAQEPCQTCIAMARTVMLDQVSFDRKPDCYGIRQITDDESVEEWEDIRTSPDVAREEANDMMATGRGEIYEVVPLYAAPQPAPAPVSDDAKDAARLDWLALAGPTSICVVIDRPHDGEVEVATDDVTGYGKTLREALDAAIAAQGGK